MSADLELAKRLEELVYRYHMRCMGSRSDPRLGHHLAVDAAVASLVYLGQTEDPSILHAVLAESERRLGDSAAAPAHSARTPPLSPRN